MMNLKTVIFPLFFFFLIAAISCEKDPSSDSVKDLSGQWDWLKTYSVAPLSDSNPLTPQNTSNNEVIIFKTDHTWFNSVNGIKTDSGKYSLGHGTYEAYQGAKIHIFDSIAYYTRNGARLDKGDYYEIRGDTLQFCPGYGGKFTSYTLPNNGSKFWIRRQ
jgi:hypothetical protein